MRLLLDYLFTSGTPRSDGTFIAEVALSFKARDVTLDVPTSDNGYALRYYEATRSKESAPTGANKNRIAQSLISL